MTTVEQDRERDVTALMQKAEATRSEAEKVVDSLRRADGSRMGEDEQLAAIVVGAVKAAVKLLWERVKAAEARVKELEARPVIRDGGVWAPEQTYEPGTIVSHNGAGWLCRAKHVSAGHAPDPNAFRMFVKSHR